MSLVNRYRNTRTRNTNNTTDDVFRPSEYENRTYESEHSTSRIQMAVRREDTRHGGRSEVVIAANRGRTDEMISLSLSEARSLKSFLDRELRMKAR